MVDIVIKITVPDETAPLFAGRDMMVTPLSDSEAQDLAAALEGLADTVDLNCRSIATLERVLETRGSKEPDIRTTLATMRGPNRRAAEMIEFVRVLLGRSARIGQRPRDRETLQ